MSLVAVPRSKKMGRDGCCAQKYKNGQGQGVAEDISHM